MDELGVEWAESALRALEEAAEYISKDSPAYAAVLVVGAIQRAESLARFPQRGRAVPEYRDAEVREVFVGSYRLIYRILPERVLILAFVHSARDLAGILTRSPE
ncbi:MAG: type II toxin-antitoxin system RelE/ParE family toxin [Thermoanaerobaculia bacterium]|jgi:plasmid stabilization system protein ParE